MKGSANAQRANLHLRHDQREISHFKVLQLLVLNQLNKRLFSRNPIPQLPEDLKRRQNLLNISQSRNLWIIRMTVVHPAAVCSSRTARKAVLDCCDQLRNDLNRSSVNFSHVQVIHQFSAAALLCYTLKIMFSIIKLWFLGEKTFDPDTTCSHVFFIFSHLSFEAPRRNGVLYDRAEPSL